MSARIRRRFYDRNSEKTVLNSRLPEKVVV